MIQEFSLVTFMSGVYLVFWEKDQIKLSVGDTIYGEEN
jgi:hypothetical protein